MSESEKRVVAVVAAYRPPQELVGMVEQLTAQVSAVIVVDDGSPPGSEQVLAELAGVGATVIVQPGNGGIAAAVNTGIATARESFDPGFVLTLDQDSRPASGYVAAAVECYRRARAAGLAVGFVTASYYGRVETPTQGSLAGFQLAFDPMQSGLVIPLRTLDAIGGLDESLFIDGVDSEFTARARRHGLEVLVGQGCELDHALGRREAAWFFGRQFGRLQYNYHSPLRVYYIVRNGTILTARYWRSQPRWVLRRLGQEGLAHGMRLGLGRHRGRTLLAMLAGFRDAAAGRRGRVRPELARRLTAGL